MSEKPFQEHNKFTQVHNYIFDQLMPILSPNAFKVLMFVVRHTRGMTDAQGNRIKIVRLRYDAIKEGTGISGNITLSWALRELRLFDLIAVDEGHEREANKYAINEDHESKSEIDLLTCKSEIDLLRKGKSKSEIDAHSKSEIDLPLKERKTKEIKAKKNGEAANDTPPAPVPPVAKSSLTAKAVTTSPPVPPRPPRHPFVEIYRETFHRYPSGAQIAQLEKAVTPNANCDQWRGVCEAWLLTGYKPTNIQGLLDWFHKGIPQPGNRNHRARAAPATPYVAKTPAEIEEYKRSTTPMEF